MNKMQLTRQLKEKAIKTGVDYNLLLLRFFMEEFLERISLSKYKNDFVFKGGFLLSSFFGISNRTTMDMDISIYHLELEESKLRDVIEEIISSNKDQSVFFEMQEIKRILENNKYAGVCVKLVGRLENIRQTFCIDFATGDPITPSAITYNYYLMISGKNIPIKSYNLETIVAEKLQTMVEKGLANSRSKDFYDLYIIFKMHKHELNLENVKQAIHNTFRYRKTKLDIDEIEVFLNLMKENKIMKNRWLQFSKTHPFANGLVYVNVVDEIFELIKVIKVQ